MAFVNADQLIMEKRDGLLLVNKPVGPTSHDIVQAVRRLTHVKRVGHAGTLDPFAEGLLIILVGRENTKRSDEFLTMDKEYEADIRLGQTSNTDDYTGVITERRCAPPSREDIESVLGTMKGEQLQMPSSFSAKKINGKKAYELARQGITPHLTPKKITIYSIDILNYAWPHLSLRTKVSSGTYVRAIARDLGDTLGCGAHVNKLKRTEIGPYSLPTGIKT